jgi:hypothetical protein
VAVVVVQAQALAVLATAVVLMVAQTVLEVPHPQTRVVAVVVEQIFRKVATAALASSM